MKFLRNIDQEQFDAFAIDCLYNHYSKTSYYGKWKKQEGFTYHLCGVEKDGKLVATALLQHKKMSFPYGSYCYVSYGYNMDYLDKELLNFINQSVIEFSREMKVTFLRIDPNVPRLEHQKDGKIKEQGFNNEIVTSQLETIGFKHLGYNYGYSGNWLSRYTYVLDLSPELPAIFKGIKRESIYHKKNILRDLRVEEVGRAGLQTLYEGELLLAKQQGFIPKPLAYFEEMYDAFEPFVHVYVASSNLSKAYTNVKEEIVHLQEELQNTSEEKTGKRNELIASISSLEKELGKMEEEGYDKKGETPLGAKLIIQMKDKVWNVNMYTFKILPNFRVAFALHRKAIEECKKRDAKSYNFEGISGSLDPKDRYYGLFDFKRSFGGDFIEYLGEFDYVFKPKQYQFYRKYSPIPLRIKKKLYQWKKGR